jgi:hypothetical protein
LQISREIETQRKRDPEKEIQRNRDPEKEIQRNRDPEKKRPRERDPEKETQRNRDPGDTDTSYATPTRPELRENLNDGTISRTQKAT